MSKMILDYDPLTAMSHWVDTDEETGITSYGVDQNVDLILDWNKALYNDDHGKWGEWAHVASIPMAMFLEWEREGILQDQDKLKQKINDPEFLYFRTRPGAV